MPCSRYHLGLAILQQHVPDRRSAHFPDDQHGLLPSARRLGGVGFLRRDAARDRHFFYRLFISGLPASLLPVVDPLCDPLADILAVGREINLATFFETC